MLKILLKNAIKLISRKIGFKLTALFLVQLLLLGNIAMACEGISAKSEEQNLSPRLCIDDSLLSNMFISGLPEMIQADSRLAPAPGFLEKLIQYALKKKKENKTFNPVYLLLKRKVDKIERRSLPYNLKAKQKKEFLKDVNKLKRLLNERKKWIKPELVREYDKQINALVELIDAVKTQGDWEDLQESGLKLNKALSKHGALATELASLGYTKKKSSARQEKSSPQANKPTNISLKTAIGASEILSEEEQTDVETTPFAVSGADVLEPSAESENRGYYGFVPSTVSARKPVLLVAVRKLGEVFKAAYTDLPFETAEDFQKKVEQLKQSIDAVQKGEFPALKKELRELEAELLKAIADNNKAITAKSRGQENMEIINQKSPANGKVNNIEKIKKPVNPTDEFSQAVTLFDSDKIPLRTIEDVCCELKGQIGLLDQMIYAEMNSSLELPVFNKRMDHDGMILQVNSSEALEKIEVGSDIVMELNGEYYSLKCDKILNAGSKLLLRPANKTKIFPSDFPQDISSGKFVYMPSTHSEDVQKKTLKAIIKKINRENKTTGISVLDYLLRIKSAVKDIDSIEELKESIPYTDGLDKFQKAAVNMIVKTKFGLILGPFGTGKTSVLLAGAKNIVLDNKKPVFIIAPQHKIADDITKRAGDCRIPVIRCGNNLTAIDHDVLEKYSRHSEAARTEFKQRYKELNPAEEDNGCLFVGTDMGASLDFMVNQLRDPESKIYLKDVTLIVDEAALINYPELITAVYRLHPEALILVGDHVQFSPYKLASRFSAKIMGVIDQNVPLKTICRYHISSFKEMMSLPFNKVSLLINYRNPWISVDLLQAWYKGVLDLQSSSKQRQDIIDEDTFVIEDTSAWEKQSFSEPYAYGSSYCNKTEALWILKRIKYFLAKGNNAKDITIITYYNGQIKLINNLIDADGDISSADAQILKQNIFTPISYQGGENKIILVSLVRSEKDNKNFLVTQRMKKKNPVFLSEPEFAKTEALLVLLSRHTGKLSVIGNKDTLDALTKQRYSRINYLYSCLFQQKDKIKVCLEIQNMELVQDKQLLTRGQDMDMMISNSI